MDEVASTPFLRISNLHKSYTEGRKQRQIFSGAKLDVAQHEITVLLGRSGSGKSTLLNLLGGIDVPEQGSIHILDTELSALNETQRTLFRREHMGYVFQFFNLIPTLKVEENLLLKLELNNISTPANKDYAFGLLNEVGIGDRRQSYPDMLSGGEQQRLAIASAIVHRPKLILADEPTGNLDSTTGQEILALLKRLVKNEGANLFMATHNKEAAALGDTVVEISKGLIRTHQEPKQQSHAS
jgi:putative ABC transport system ATP-binding protein